MAPTDVSPCDCCGGREWRELFTLSGVDLGRCQQCALHYVSPLPTREERTAEVHLGRFRGEEEVTSAELQLAFERQSEERFRGYVELAARHAPPGRWLDVGCGTGTLMRLAQERGVEIEGVELGDDRRELAQRMTEATVHDRPVEELDLEPGSLAAATMIDVFSHLTSPRETLSVIGRALTPNGVLVLHTSEVGLGVRPHHQPSWELGEHLFFLGEGTIESYADSLGMKVVQRDRIWMPETVFTRERFRMKGRSALRNAVKAAFLYTPGAFRALRWYMLRRRQADNPVHVSTIALVKT